MGNVKGINEGSEFEETTLVFTVLSFIIPIPDNSKINPLPIWNAINVIPNVEKIVFPKNKITKQIPKIYPVVLKAIFFRSLTFLSLQTSKNNNKTKNGVKRKKKLKNVLKIKLIITN